MATWLKWVPVAEQLEILPRGDTEETPGVDSGPEAEYIDNVVSVSALRTRTKAVSKKQCRSATPLQLSLFPEDR